MTHIVEAGGDKLTLCRIKSAEVAIVGRAHASNHQWPQARCTDCYTLAGLVWMLDPDLTTTVQP